MKTKVKKFSASEQRSRRNTPLLRTRRGIAILLTACLVFTMSAFYGFADTADLQAADTTDPTVTLLPLNAEKNERDLVYNVPFGTTFEQLQQHNYLPKEIYGNYALGTVVIPVEKWEAAPIEKNGPAISYDGNISGVYAFAPKLPSELVLADSAEQYPLIWIVVDPEPVVIPQAPPVEVPAEIIEDGQADTETTDSVDSSDSVDPDAQVVADGLDKTIVNEQEEPEPMMAAMGSVVEDAPLSAMRAPQEIPAQFLKIDNWSIKVGSTTITNLTPPRSEPIEVKDGDPFTFDLNWSVDDAWDIQAGDTITIHMLEGLPLPAVPSPTPTTIDPGVTPLVVYGADNITPIGTLIFDSNMTIKLTFNDGLKNLNKKKGNIYYKRDITYTLDPNPTEKITDVFEDNEFTLHFIPKDMGIEGNIAKEFVNFNSTQSTVDKINWIIDVNTGLYPLKGSQTVSDEINTGSDNNGHPYSPHKFKDESTTNVVVYPIEVNVATGQQTVGSNPISSNLYTVNVSNDKKMVVTFNDGMLNEKAYRITFTTVPDSDTASSEAAYLFGNTSRIGSNSAQAKSSIWNTGIANSKGGVYNGKADGTVGFDANENPFPTAADHFITWTVNINTGNKPSKDLTIIEDAIKAMGLEQATITSLKIGGASGQEIWNSANPTSNENVISYTPLSDVNGFNLKLKGNPIQNGQTVNKGYQLVFTTAVTTPGDKTSFQNIVKINEGSETATVTPPTKIEILNQKDGTYVGDFDVNGDPVGTHYIDWTIYVNKNNALVTGNITIEEKDFKNMGTGLKAPTNFSLTANRPQNNTTQLCATTPVVNDNVLAFTPTTATNGFTMTLKGNPVNPNSTTTPKAAMDSRGSGYVLKFRTVVENPAPKTASTGTIADGNVVYPNIAYITGGNGEKTVGSNPKPGLGGGYKRGDYNPEASFDSNTTTNPSTVVAMPDKDAHFITWKIYINGNSVLFRDNITVVENTVTGLGAPYDFTLTALKDPSETKIPLTDKTPVANDNIVSYTKNGTGSGFTLVLKGNPVNPNSKTNPKAVFDATGSGYLLTFKTPVTSPTPSTSYKNIATINGASVDWTVTSPGKPADPTIVKNIGRVEGASEAGVVMGENSWTVPWTSQIQAGTKNLTINRLEDTYAITTDPAISNLNMTLDHDSMVIMNGGVEVPPADYDITDTVDGFTIDFKTPVVVAGSASLGTQGAILTLSYNMIFIPPYDPISGQLTLDDGLLKTIKFENWLKAIGLDGTTEWTRTGYAHTTPSAADYMRNGSKSGKFSDAANGIIEWTIKANVNGRPLPANGLIMNDIFPVEQTWISDGEEVKGGKVEYVSDSIKVFKDGDPTPLQEDAYDFKIAGDPEDPTLGFVLTIKQPGNSKYEVKYETKIIGNPLPYSTRNNRTYLNKVEIVGWSDLSAEVQARNLGSMVRKSGAAAYDEDNSKASWEVTVNAPNSLIRNAKIFDGLGIGHEVDRDSIMVYKGSNAGGTLLEEGEGKDYVITYDTYNPNYYMTFTITFSDEYVFDSVHYLTYTTTINREAEINDRNQQVVGNRVLFTGNGVEINSEDVKVPHSWEDAGGSVRGEKIPLRILKLDKNTQEPLGGATFLLESKDRDEPKTVTTMTLEEAVEAGDESLVGYSEELALFNGDYIVTEIVAPEGYALSAPSFIEFSAQSDSPDVKTRSGEDGEDEYYIELVFENIKLGEIEVEKEVVTEVPQKDFDLDFEFQLLDALGNPLLLPGQGIVSDNGPVAEYPDDEINEEDEINEDDEIVNPLDASTEPAQAEMTIKFYNKDGEELDAPYKVISGNPSDVGKFTLKHGEKAVISNIPVGGYFVKEAYKKPFETVYKYAGGLLPNEYDPETGVDVSIDNDNDSIKVLFTNTSTLVPVIACEVDKDTIWRTSAFYVSLPDQEDFNNVADNEQYRYDVNARSVSNINADDFRIVDNLENVKNNIVRVDKLWTPIVWGDVDGLYRINYKTRLNGDTMLSFRNPDPIPGIDPYELLTRERYKLDFSDTNDTLTYIELVYGEVEVGFTSMFGERVSLNGEHRNTNVDGSLLPPDTQQPAKDSIEYIDDKNLSPFNANAKNMSILSTMLEKQDRGLTMAPLASGYTDKGLNWAVTDPDAATYNQDLVDAIANGLELKPMSYLVSAMDHHAGLEGLDIVSSASSHIYLHNYDANGTALSETPLMRDQDQDAVVTKQIVTFEAVPENTPVDGLQWGDPIPEEIEVEQELRAGGRPYTPESSSTTPISRGVQTGDTALLGLWTVLMMGAAICIIMLVGTEVTYRRRAAKAKGGAK